MPTKSNSQFELLVKRQPWHGKRLTYSDGLVSYYFMIFPTKIWLPHPVERRIMEQKIRRYRISVVIGDSPHLDASSAEALAKQLNKAATVARQLTQRYQGKLTGQTDRI